MAHMPDFLEEGTPEAETWQEIERNGMQQGVDPSSGPVAIRPDPRLRRAIDNLVAAGGAQITSEDAAEHILRIQLTYHGEPGLAPLRPPRTKATGKASVFKM